MVTNGLLLKEMRQSITGLITTSAVLIIYLPWMLLNSYSAYLKYGDEVFHVSLMDTGFNGFVMILPFILAISQIGTEKQRGSMDFTLSLPYSRGSIFWTKWLIGLGTIFAGLAISYLISSGILFFTDAVIDGSMTRYYFYTFLSAVMIYTLVFAAGCLTGTSFAQGLVAVSVLLLPVLVFSVVGMNLEVFGDASVIYSDRLMERVGLFSGVTTFLYQDKGSYGDFVVPLLLTILYTAVGYFTFRYHPAERTGYFFLWKKLNLPVFLIVLFLGTFGFAGFGYMVGNESFVGYFSGLVIGAAFGAALGYFFIYKKAR
ncbi:hypothetical protein CEF21_17930 [Bacillus sp. FJAT-42376]|uniref:ABC transporter permease subunit n=1 Tax=Bacillus sp. FJAT-42376 TaxID=2014076 RepID=UPI000F50A70A|nr:ABC transporter permease subunit [Bacillus sp. FJAT-42376]AZB44043.1 hypothetical protein CEF21_17930 [Bacillus sp. FJAT-42376]